jgi:hypothetical protein
MSFRPEEFNGRPAVNSRYLQYYHTDFMNTPEQAYQDFAGKVKLMRAYGDIQFLDIQLMRVYGSGPLPEKHFRLVREFNEPEDVPGFNNIY